MKRLLTFSISLLFAFYTNAQSNIADFDDASIYFSGIFGVTSTLDEYGNVFIDMADADNQLSFRITDVTISMEEKADDPPIVLIDFTCRKTECITTDPSFGTPPVQTNTLTIRDAKRGKKAHTFLLSLQEFIKNN